MDQAQIMSLVRHVLTAAGALLAGTWLAQYFTVDNISAIAAVLATIIATIWGNRSSTPVALAQKLVANDYVNNEQAGKAIAAGMPEAVKVMEVVQPSTGPVTKANG